MVRQISWHLSTYGTSQSLPTYTTPSLFWVSAVVTSALPPSLLEALLQMSVSRGSVCCSQPKPELSQCTAVNKHCRRSAKVAPAWAAFSSHLYPYKAADAFELICQAFVGHTISVRLVLCAPQRALSPLSPAHSENKQTA